jgi:hypothetical protein
MEFTTSEASKITRKVSARYVQVLLKCSTHFVRFTEVNLSVLKCDPPFRSFLTEKEKASMSTSCRHAGVTEVYLHSFLTSAQDGSGWGPGCFPREKLRYFLNRRLGGVPNRCGWFWRRDKISCYRDKKKPGQFSRKTRCYTDFSGLDHVVILSSWRSQLEFSKTINTDLCLTESKATQSGRYVRSFGLFTRLPGLTESNPARLQC